MLSKQAVACDVMLVIIGPNWLDARDEAGARRLDNPNDFVRIEVEAARRGEQRAARNASPQATGLVSRPRRQGRYSIESGILWDFL